MNTFANILWTLTVLPIGYGHIAVIISRELLSLNFPLFSADIGSLMYSGLRFCGLIIIIIGAVMNLKCYWDLIFFGEGTVSPLMPTEKLVSRGLYQFMRNPIYVGLCIIFFGEAIFFMSAVLLLYSLLWFLVLNLTVVFKEEPSLKQKFGESYEKYFESVPRWIPRLTPYR